MEEIRHFLEISTIHGLNFISSKSKYTRLFWIFVVFGGFIGAGYLIHESFDNWNLSPVSTTIETLPISEFTFPNVTVCPPKNSFLDLNYDVIQADKVEIDKQTRIEMIENASMTIVQDSYEEMMKNLSKVEDPDRFYNWYHRYTRIVHPNNPNYGDNVDYEFGYRVDTTATSGNISTHLFGDKFDAKKVDSSIQIKVVIWFPTRARKSNGTTLYIDIHKNTIEQFRDTDKFMVNLKAIEGMTSHISRNITSPFHHKTYGIVLNRKVSKEDLSILKKDLMPGFRLKWYYKSESNKGTKFPEDTISKEFVRYYFVKGEKIRKQEIRKFQRSLTP